MWHRDVFPGKKYGGQTVIEEVTQDRNGFRRFLCECICGNRHEVSISNLGKSARCRACCRPERTLASQHPRTYVSYQCMMGRCYRKKDPAYPKYGGAGIKVCDRWKGDFAAFLSDMGERPEGKTIDRIHLHHDYQPGNCRWATPQEQADSRLDLIRVGGMSLHRFCKTHGIPYQSAYMRLQRGKITAEELASDPVKAMARVAPKPKGRRIAGLSVAAFCRKHGLPYQKTFYQIRIGKVTVEQLELDYI